MIDMSADIDILETSDAGISLEIGTRSVGIRVSDPDENAIIFFDMMKPEHRQALKVMIEALQHQLEVHSET